MEGLALHKELPEWPATPQGQLLKGYWEPLLQQGPASFIANVHSRLGVLYDQEAALPLSYDPVPHDSYVVSPLSHYVHYAKEELRLLPQPWMQKTLRVLLNAMGVWLGALGIERSVYINNWLLSTNLYPTLSPQQVAGATHTLLRAFPQRPLVFRSVEAYTQGPLMRTLLELGYRPIFSRQIYIQTPAQVGFWRNRQLQEDRRRLKKVSAVRLEANQINLMQAKALYDQLYLQKYSLYNPQFSLNFLQHALNSGWLWIRGFALEGVLQAVMGAWRLNGVMTQPLFGYNLHSSKAQALYRLLSYHTLQDAAELGLLINASGGAGQFKRLRGGIPTMEYNMVYVRHLPRGQRMAWQALEQLLHRAALVIRQGGY